MSCNEFYQNNSYILLTIRLTFNGSLANKNIGCLVYFLLKTSEGIE